MLVFQLNFHDSNGVLTGLRQVEQSLLDVSLDVFRTNLRRRPQRSSLSCKPLGGFVEDGQHHRQVSTASNLNSHEVIIHASQKSLLLSTTCWRVNHVNPTGGAQIFRIENQLLRPLISDFGFSMVIQLGDQSPESAHVGHFPVGTNRRCSGETKFIRFIHSMQSPCSPSTLLRPQKLDLMA